MTVKIGELRGELLSVETSKTKSSHQVTRARVEILLESGAKVDVPIPVDLPRHDELAEHVGRQVRVSFEVFPAKEPVGSGG